MTTNHEPERDERLRAMLRRFAADAALSPAERDRLTARIGAVAAARLEDLRVARLAPPRAWWMYVAIWARPAIPLAAASVVALGFILRSTGAPWAGGAEDPPEVDFLQVATRADAPETLVRLAVGSSALDWLSQSEVTR